ncbi:MAG: hypothetical protein LHW46_02395 [Candidatus Cloacimonetes bacterium]|nr:hypothetical protein [Candidatus Cloacimonadota bacterium]
MTIDKLLRWIDGNLILLMGLMILTASQIVDKVNSDHNISPEGDTLHSEGV